MLPLCLLATIYIFHNSVRNGRRGVASLRVSEIKITEWLTLPIGLVTFATMIPIYDHNPTRGRPTVTLILIILNVLIFLFEFSLSPRQLQALFESYAIIPRELVTMVSAEFFTLITSQFLHGGWWHLLGNMVYLWIFGDNLEERLGHLRFLLFYLLTGFIAGLAQVVIEPSSSLPIVGASGAIAGVLGGYLLLYPLARVTTIIPIFFFARFPLPAILVLGFWFITQFFNGVASIGAPTETGGGVAFFAHIGGFIAGFVLVRLFGRKQAQSPIDPNFNDHY